MKTFKEFQDATEIYGPKYDRDTAFIHLMEEIGEVAKNYSKYKRKGYFNIEDTQELAYELGDVLATLTLFARQYGWGLEDLARMNVKKLKFREGIND